MSPADYELMNLVSPKIVKRNTRFRAAIPVQERLAVTLQFLATHHSYTRMQYLFQISKQTCQIVPEVCEAIFEAPMENIQIKNCVLYRANCFTHTIDVLEHWNKIYNSVLLITELLHKFKGTSVHSELRVLNQQQRKEWWERKPGMLVTEWRHDMKHQNSPSRQGICCRIFCAALYLWWAANNFWTSLLWKCQNFGVCCSLWRWVLLLLLTLSV